MGSQFATEILFRLVRKRNATIGILYSRVY